MPNNEGLENIIKTAIKVIVVFIILLLLAYGVSKSDFNNIKKYDEKDDSQRTELPMSKQKSKSAQERRFSTKVVISGGDLANLGDFELNIQGGKKLVMNMSLKFKDNNKNKGWFSSSDVKQEIVTKGVVLRSTVIDTLSHYNNVDINNEKMQESLIQNMNNYLSEGEVEQIYFNKYLTH